MSTPVLTVMNALAAGGLGLTKGTNLYAFEVDELSGAIDMVAVLPGGGASPIRSMGGTKELRPAIVRIRVRNTAFPTGYTLCHSIMDVLRSVTIAGSEYIEAIDSEPYYLGQNEEGRHLWTLGFVVWYNSDI